MIYHYQYKASCADGYDWGTPVERGTEEWWRMCLLRNKSAHAKPDSCKNSAQKNFAVLHRVQMPLLEGVAASETTATSRSLVRGRCMICHKPLQRSQRGPKVHTMWAGSVVQQSYAIALMRWTFIEENVTAAHSREKLGLPDWG
ncbi:hypothetical protein KQX54_000149 [Cotesia glomerata]|uniref:Uncharacterized protein n=1 Tax=Cotesia glomerata TaxID=32391 RepID=A0AAV7I3D5_COTGL|nr:hypothetical protein KQX54_000149 [Cotesia glomerata]